MKIFVLVLLTFAIASHAFSQTSRLDSLFGRLAVEKDEKKILATINQIYTDDWTSQKYLPVSKRLVALGKDINSPFLQAAGYSIIGSQYHYLGNPIQALRQHQLGMQFARQTGNADLLGFALRQAAHIYKEQEDYPRAIALYKEAIPYAAKGNDDSLATAPYINLGWVYLQLGKLDSALMCAQRAYEGSIRLKHGYDLGFIYMTLGGIHSRLGNQAIAANYLHLAINQSLKESKSTDLCRAYTAMAEHYQLNKQADSSTYYARLALKQVQGTSAFFYSATAAKLLVGIYKGSNCDSSDKYAQIAETASDSITSTKTSRQIQLMTYEEDNRRLEEQMATTKAENTRQQNIQYALIALGIMLFLTLYLILSRSFITNTKTIEYAGVIGLLIVFEFLNLLLHPWLERITHHSPILMLLCLVAIAALLVPFHHRLEKWALSTLVAKNKEIRLSQARRTIQQLGE